MTASRARHGGSALPGRAAALGAARDPPGLPHRRAYPLALLLRIHCVQLFYNLSEAMEDALYDSVAVQRFVGLARDPRPDETTILTSGPAGTTPPGRGATGGDHPAPGGRAYGARSWTRPSSTGTAPRRATRRCIVVLGMKAHGGGRRHRAGAPRRRGRDAGRVGARRGCGATRGIRAWSGPEHRGRAMDWQVALRPGQRRRLPPGSVAAQVERRKAAIRAKVEHPFLYVKRHFDATVRYRGLEEPQPALPVVWAESLLAERGARVSGRPARRSDSAPITAPRRSAVLVQSFPRLTTEQLCWSVKG